ncbi:hypothetical protein N7468_009496 [Penicillium chermesinum]|uniref:Major facilitator superfamily (MFS) profile domain-containing protein n=1 Tax=Penicillium chermesinum TaxID=63820 RepID=A0A9W9TEW4_9EURO|nr:uncharacterized protein N7468_009496 [Penicillium chermesinum]KAJ5220292.1 hypothetical protein N7468_009496 [Penicillium chermesinum]
MQSYLQYRRLGKVVQKQLGGDTENGNSSRDEERTICEKEEEDPTETPQPHAESNPSPLAQSRSHRSANTSLAYNIPGVNAGMVRMILRIQKNYPFWRRVRATVLVACLAWVVTASSSINSAVQPQAMAEYGVSEVVGSLLTAMFLLGFATGSLVSGPLSEILGRNMVYISSMVLFALFTMATGLGPNIGSQIILRFLAGFFGCPPLTCAGGTIADLWNPLEKTIFFPVYAILSFGGPILSPVIASYMGQTGVLSWRWSNWIILIMSGLVLVLILLFQPETYGPLLLKWKGRQLRRQTGDSRFRSPMDLQKIALFSRIGSAMKRQIVITIHEPIILLISLYMTVLYIVLFTFFDGYPYIFQDTYGISQGLTNIIWLAMYIGIGMAAFLVFPIYKHTKTKFTAVAVAANRPDPTADPHALDGLHTPPEIRLWFAMVGAALIPISLFWMGWTDYASVSIWSPIVASGFFGLGTICIFLSSYMYVIDSYDMYAASALGFMTVSRYMAAGGMTVVGVPFYHNMGVHWTLTIMGAISTLMVPIPFIFYWYGPTIRSWSKYAVTEVA